MALTATTVKLGANLSRELFIKGVSEISKGITSNIDKRLKIINTESKANELFKKIYNVRKVKTLWQMEKPADITSFYHTPKLELKKGRKVEVHSLNDINTSDNVVVLGIAGQGKSMLMRQLCVSELAQGKRIPLFIELRKISNELTLNKLIANVFDALDLTDDPRVWDYLYKEAKACLLLDGFDEISDKFLARTVAEIEQLSDKYDALKIVISSRPDSGTDGLRRFHRTFISNLEGEDYQAVILRLLGEEESDLYEEIVDKIESNTNGIKQFLTTPLMVTLLLVKYKLTKDIPENFTAFYDGILDVLLTRHDSLKPGYARHRKSSLSDHEFREVFESLAFNLSGKGAEIEEEFLYDATRKALSERKQKCRAEAFIADLVKITCLLLKDGRNYRFVHKSVQEYYSAAYISRKSEVWVESLFKTIREKSFYRQMEASINFLSELDQYKWNAYFLKPMLKHVLGGYPNGEPIVDSAKRIFKACGVGGDPRAKMESILFVSHFMVNDEIAFLGKYGVHFYEVFDGLGKAFRLHVEKIKSEAGKLDSHLNCMFNELIQYPPAQQLIPTLEKALLRATRRLAVANDEILRANATFKGFSL